ncbi:DNA-methyltransferase [Trabulsiella odontotermitis]|uniref:DNA-methyltransferase n=1 Tax=Trabulsiella odontotermitis TaxID=379893 RepID=UPI00092D1414|nr:site-specific DNA-methyltransferase [Trabulsiella odontotermitis]
MKSFFSTKKGKLYLGDSLSLLKESQFKKYIGKVNLIITSPPFPLNNKKKYGNEIGEKYKEWFTQLAPVFNKLLTDDGSVIIEIGNAWEPGRPVQSTLHLECLLALIKAENSELRLIQEFICYNPAKLPSPAQWVTVNRFRTVDSYTHIWWLAKNDFPKADNSKVLRPYSKSMKKLLERQSYNSGLRPSEHNISKEGFLNDHGGSIAHNFFELESLEDKREVRLPHNVLSFSNVSSNDFFTRSCKAKGLQPHPARMNKGVVEFFIDFLSDEDDLILDPFGGSNTTGHCAERKNRKWLAFEINESYAEQSIIRFSE